MNQFLLDIKILYSLWSVIRAQDFFIGQTVENFEKSLCVFTRSSHAMGVSSGTDALILSLKALGIGAGDEVIIPAISFFSTASAVSWVGATPVFVDIDPKSKTIDVSLAEKAITKKTKAVIPVHLDGRMADVDALAALGKKRSIFIIVDGAHAIGSRYKNREVGECGDIVCLSFSFTKPFGSYGNAGAILTNNKALYEKIAPFRMYGATSKKGIYSNNSVPSGSHRMDSFQAAVLNCKLPLWHTWMKKQREHYLLYQKTLSGVPGIILPDTHPDFFHNGFRFTFLSQSKIALKEFLSRTGMSIPDYYSVPLPLLPAFKYMGHARGDFPVAEEFARESVTLPTRFSLSTRSVNAIAARIRDFCQRMAH
ncbi:MAG: DegT/DnrJ/EryC1/StrS family aminotransferase [Patescibacteria group bacterium]